MLKCKVSVYVPSTFSGDQPMPVTVHNQIVHDVAGKLSAEFGGATATKGTGFWLSDSHGLIEESVTIVTSYHDHDVKQAVAFITKIAQEIKAGYCQEAVTIETESGIDFI